MRTKSKFRSAGLTLLTLLLVVSLAAASMLTAQAIVVPGEEDWYYDEGMLGLTKYRYDHDTKTIYLTHAGEDYQYVTSGQHFLSDIYINEAEHLVVDSNIESVWDKDYNVIYREPNFSQIADIASTPSKIRDIKVNKVEGEYEHVIVRDNVMFYVTRVAVDSNSGDPDDGQTKHY